MWAELRSKRQRRLNKIKICRDVWNPFIRRMKIVFVFNPYQNENEKNWDLCTKYIKERGSGTQSKFNVTSGRSYVEMKVIILFKEINIRVDYNFCVLF